MKSRASNAAVSALAIAIAAGTLVVMLLSPPESIDAVSQDGAVRLEGRGPSDVSVAIQPLSTVPGPISDIRGQAYGIVMTQGKNPRPSQTFWTLTFIYDPSVTGDVSPWDLVVLRFDVDQAAWVARPAVVDAQQRTLTVDLEGDPTGMWALGVAPSLSGV
jgi:hypothetical protein